jgi:hypothetical protein
MTQVIVECPSPNLHRLKEVLNSLLTCSLNCSLQTMVSSLIPNFPRSQQLHIPARISRVPSLVGPQSLHHTSNGQGSVVIHASIDHRNSTHPRLPDLLYQKSARLFSQIPEARRKVHTGRLYGPWLGCCIPPEPTRAWMTLAGTLIPAIRMISL